MGLPTELAVGSQMDKKAEKKISRSGYNKLSQL